MMRLFSAQFVVVEENLWFSEPSSSSVARRTVRQRVATHVFVAIDLDDALRKATEMIGGFDDAHNDGPGDRTNLSCSGLHDLDEVQLLGKTINEGLTEPYGLEVGMVDLEDSAFAVRQPSEFSMFKYRTDQPGESPLSA
jgi:hypothetical protein